jgi:hypothetical protein
MFQFHANRLIRDAQHRIDDQRAQLQRMIVQGSPTQSADDRLNDRLNGFLWGLAIAGVVVPIALIKGFGWSSVGQAQTFARQEAHAAVVKVLTPLCVANFQGATDAPTKLTALKSIDSPWQRETFVREGKWAFIGKDQESGVIGACAAELYKL